jgi:hypothetical protein
MYYFLQNSIDVRRSVAQHLKSSIDQLESLNPKLENDEERGDHNVPDWWFLSQHSF